MLRKIISLMLVSLMLVAFLCSCKDKPTDGSSSVDVQSEITSDAGDYEDESSDIADEEDGNDWGDIDWGDEESEFSESEIEIENEYEIKPVIRPGDDKSKVSSTVSAAISNPNINEAKTIYTVGYHFTQGWCKALGTSDEARYTMWESFLKEDYFNCIITDANDLLNAKTRELIKKYDLTFWIHNFGYYKSSDKDSPNNSMSIDKFLEDTNSKQAVEVIKKDPDLWNRFLGFHTEENVFRNQTSEDYLAETKAYYLLAGKRLFLCCATSEYTDKEDNFEINYIENERNDLKTWACKYVTDAGFDSYGHDVRPGITTSDATIQSWKERFPLYPDFASVTNENANREYFKMHTHALQTRIGHPVYAWYFPSGYYHYIGNGLNGQRYSDEKFCLAHLEHFVDLVENYNKYKGGVAIYAFAEGANADGNHLVRHLECNDKYGNSLVFQDDAKWPTYSAYLKALTKRWRSAETDVLDYKQYTE